MNQILIENKAGKIRLNDVVCKPVIDELMREIGKLFGASAAANGADFGEITNCAENAVDVLTIEVNSPGGSIFDGYDIYNEIQSLRGRGVVVNAIVTGMAASMASVICMACDRVEMVPHARMMIHEASQGVRGNSEELRKAADLLDGISADIANIYSTRTGKSQEEIRKLMKAETWMTAAECVSNGFADAVFDIRAEKAKNETASETAAESNTSTNMSILAKLFPDNDQVAKLEAAVAENDTLRSELTEAQAKITELSGLSAVIAEKDAEITALADAKAALESQVSELSAKVENIPATITETLAAVGQSEPLENNEAPPQKSHAEIWASLKGAESTAYFNQHEKEIMAELRK